MNLSLTVRPFTMQTLVVVVPASNCWRTVTVSERMRCGDISRPGDDIYDSCSKTRSFREIARD